MNAVNTPTTHQFNKYQSLYNYFNGALFNGELPTCLLILSRKSARMCGHFSSDRWQDEEGKKCHEINLNPRYMAAATDMNICQTLVHEMAHLWQFELGKPSRTGYHNKEWATKMEEIGLMPSNTGKPGGKKTGQQMDDYTIEDGAFMDAFNALPEEYILPFKSSEIVNGVEMIGGETVTGEDGETPAPVAPVKKNKCKYTCGCGINVWGKPELKINCGECNSEFVEQ